MCVHVLLLLLKTPPVGKMVCYPPRAAPLALATPRHRDLQPARRRDHPLAPHGVSGGPKGYDKHRHLDKAQATRERPRERPQERPRDLALDSPRDLASDNTMTQHRIPLPQCPRRNAFATAYNTLCAIIVMPVRITFVACMVELLTHEHHIRVPRHAYDGHLIFSAAANTLPIAQTVAHAPNTSTGQPVYHTNTLSAHALLVVHRPHAHVRRVPLTEAHASASDLISSTNHGGATCGAIQRESHSLVGTNHKRARSYPVSFIIFKHAGIKLPS